MEVELDDAADAPGTPVRAADGAPSDAGRPPDAPHDGEDRRARRGRGLRAAALATCVVLALVVVANVVELRRDRERAARIEGLPGVVDSLAEPLTERWRADGWVSADLGELLLLDTPDGIRAVDPATGETAWRMGSEERERLGVDHCRLPGDSTYIAGQEQPRPEVVLCVPPLWGTDTGTGAVALLVLDVRTGEVLRTLETAGRPLTLEWVDDGVVLLLATPEGTVRAVAWDLATGTLRWDTTTTTAVFRPGGGDEGLLNWQRLDEVALLTGSTGDVAVDLTTGAEVTWDGSEEMPTGEIRVELADGSTLVWVWNDEDAGGRVEDEGGGTRFRLTDVPMLPLVDDGAVTDVLVVDGQDGVRGLDLATGEELWVSEVPDGFGLLSIDGTLVVANGGRIVALDMRHGTTLWEEEAGSLGYPTTPTDGELLLRLERATDPMRTAGPEDSVLVARSIADGREVWRLPLGTPAHDVITTRDGHVVISTDEGVVGLG